MTSTHSPFWRRPLALCLIACLLAFGNLLAQSTLDPFKRAQAAHALTITDAGVRGLGPRVNFQNWVGQFRHSSGKLVFCVEMLTKGRSHTTHDGNGNIDADFITVDSYGHYDKASFYGSTVTYPGVSARDVKKISVIASMNATSTVDDVRAAAAQLAIWKLVGEESNQGYQNYYQKLLNQIDKQTQQLRGHGMETEVALVLQEAENVVAGAEAQIQDAQSRNRAITVHSVTPTRGNATYPRGAISAQIQGGVFLRDGQEVTSVNFTQPLATDITLEWRAVPTAKTGWNRYVQLSFSGKGKATHTVIGKLLKTTEKLFQTTVTSEEKPRLEESEYPLEGAVHKADLLWAPVLTTQVETEFLRPGAHFSDTVTFAAAAGNTWRWRQGATGIEFTPITAQGTLYGPFAVDPRLHPKTTPPADAPIVGTTTLTTSLTQGPGTYRVPTAWQAHKAGYYSWVWEIKYADQAEQVRSPKLTDTNIPPAAALPENYYYTDGFGRATEGHAVSVQPIIHTELDRQIVRHDALALRDTVRIGVTNAGHWPSDSTGEPMQVRVHLTAYGSQKKPVRSKNVPADAVILNTGMVTVAGDNQPATSPEIRFTAEQATKYQYVTVQACIRKQDQSTLVQKLIEEHCDDWGVPSETAEFEWLPELTTQVETVHLDKGEKFNDTVNFFVRGLDEKQSRAYGWHRTDDGKFYTVQASGKLYGPFDRDPQHFPSPRVPQAYQGRVVATASVRTDAQTGPGTYRITSEPVREAGYYTWVWEINHSEQQDADTRRTIPADYAFSDGFGAAGESTIGRTTLIPKTQLDKQELTLMDLSFRDSLIAQLVDGQWLMQEENGKRVPAVFRLTVYGVTVEVVQQQTAPAEAVEIARGKVTVDTQDKAVLSDQLRISIHDFLKYDALTVQACVLREDQPAGKYRDFIKETCDDFGVHAETATFVKPLVTTKAQSSALVGETIHDVATLRGSAVPEGSKIVFTAYLKPVAGQPKYDENWQPILDAAGNALLWSAAETADPNAVCTAQPVAKTPAISVSKQGDYVSPKVVAHSAGTVYWVEQLTVPDPDNPEQQIVVHTGKCGLPEETTLVTVPPPPVLIETGSPLSARFTALSGSSFVLLGAFALLIIGCRQQLRRSR